jgi:hypothetical protein
MTNAPVAIPAHAVVAVATAGQNNHVHFVTGGNTTSIVNRYQKKRNDG